MVLWMSSREMGMCQPLSQHGMVRSCSRCSDRAKVGMRHRFFGSQSLLPVRQYRADYQWDLAVDSGETNLMIVPQ